MPLLGFFQLYLDRGDGPAQGEANEENEENEENGTNNDIDTDDNTDDGNDEHDDEELGAAPKTADVYYLVERTDMDYTPNLGVSNAVSNAVWGTYHVAPIDGDGVTEATADSLRVWYAAFGTVHVVLEGEGENAILQWRHNAEADGGEVGLIIPPLGKMGFSASVRHVSRSERYSLGRGAGGVIILGKPFVDDPSDVALYRFFAPTARDFDALCDMIGIERAGSVWRIAPTPLRTHALALAVAALAAAALAALAAPLPRCTASRLANHRAARRRTAHSAAPHSAAPRRAAPRVDHGAAAPHPHQTPPLTKRALPTLSYVAALFLTAEGQDRTAVPP